MQLYWYWYAMVWNRYGIVMQWYGIDIDIGMLLVWYCMVLVLVLVCY